MSCYTEELITEVLKQIVEDVANGDVTAIEELIQNIQPAYLEGFLKEDNLLALREKWNMDVPPDYLYEC